MTVRKLFYAVVLSAWLATCPAAFAQTTPPAAQAQAQDDLRRTFVGEWVGVLEYRDYSQPATSTERVFLPTWLSVKPNAAGVTRHFIYDDGPSKTVDETDSVVFDLVAGTYTETDTGKPGSVQKVSNYETLKSGRGDLMLTGTGMDNDKPTETRTRLTLRRNLVSWTLEVRPAGSTEAFSFRHRFTFTRATVPVVTTH